MACGPSRPVKVLASVLETKVKNRLGALTEEDGTCGCCISSNSSRTETGEDSLARESSVRAPSSQEEIQVQTKSDIGQAKSVRKVAKRQRQREVNTFKIISKTRTTWP